MSGHVISLFRKKDPQVIAIATRFLGLLGIQAAQPIADVFTLVLTLFIVHGIFKGFPEEN